jgi:NAD-dependent deacetylase
MARRIVAFTGAGISKASGIPTYEEAPELRKLFQIETFTEDPYKFMWDYQKVFERIAKAKPNSAHQVLADYAIPVITQNIDGLHARAGYINVTELHGSYNFFRCLNCGHRAYQKTLPLTPECPKCGKPTMRPDIVFYGEEVHDYGYATDKIYAADVLLVVGTSLTTYPANTLVLLAQHRGMDVITVNRDAEKRLPEILEVLTSV